MDYNKIYNNLITRAKTRNVVNEYVELHHIIPKCLGGNDDATNLVYLTAREHFIAHQILCKLHPSNSKLSYAVHIMTLAAPGQKRTNRMYEWLRKAHADNMSKLHKNKIVSDKTKKKMSLAKKGKSFGENNNFYGKTHTEEYKKACSQRQKVAQLGANNSNAKTWKIQFPDGSINNIKCLKEFCKTVGISVYRIRNNKASGYVLMEIM